jgi:alkaline phosphatase D
VSDPARTLLGDAQERWLFAGLHSSPARWNVVGQQTIMAQMDYDLGDGVSVNHDQWDGYRVSRERFLRYVDRVETANPVVLSGDWHSAWVNDLRLDFDRPETPATATEFVGTSISSCCGWADAVERARPANPHVRYLDARQRGYLSVGVTAEQWRTDYRVVTSAADTADPAVTDSSWVVENGRPGAQRA